MTTWLRNRSLLWLFVGALVLPVLAVEAPVEAQRSSSVRARRARAARLRAQRSRMAQRRARGRAALASDFATEPRDDERPPPMDTSSEEQGVDAATMDERRRALDPELFGDPDAASFASEPGRYSPLAVRAGLRLFHRGLSYQDYERGAVTNYDLPVGAAVAIDLEYYPAAHALNDAWAHLGVGVSLAHSLALESVGPEGVAYPTTAYAWHVAARYRIPIDEAGGEIAVEAGAGEHGFRVERGAMQNPDPEGVPDTDYDFLRVGLSGRFVIGDVTLGARLAYLPVLGAGEIASSSYFGGADVHGFEGGVELTYDLGLGLAIMAAVDVRVFALSFGSSTSAPAAAGGALDRSIGGNVGLRWTMPSHAELAGPVAH